MHVASELRLIACCSQKARFWIFIGTINANIKWEIWTRMDGQGSNEQILQREILVGSNKF